ncbi:DUF2235 domain-containing protein [Ornithobacterium rhinotracheale]|uniref:DUF2235 domain-containing protein n=1 Tax=Ornithobacterium rhinotracheale TaxID=28251 RepID=A0A3R5UR22_ORNRH|nr:DUF2235 domain-containing protein [Ornithobacterium rhinotracheale]QAR30230.1 DUF2235 domain-containing protein [Ornithobacterium rhinotracheale]
MARTFVYNTGSLKESIEDIHLQVGVFFDGTANNRTNTMIRKKYYAIEEGKGQKPSPHEKRIYETIGKNSTSFSNDFSNVARQSFSTEPNQYTIYVEGIGTMDKEKDDSDGLGFGVGKAGIRKKVRKGCEELAKRIDTIVGDKKKSTKSMKIYLTIDVFGFSRGAAAARNFLHEINGNDKKNEIIKKGSITYYKEERTIPNYGNNYQKVKYIKKKREALLDIDGEEVKKSQYLMNNRYPKLGYLGYCLLSQGILKKEELEALSLDVRFVGLYDTVASYDKDKSLINGALSKGFDGAVKSLKLNDIGSFARAVHFTAMDEHRINFALTRLPKISKVEEFDLPGVHSDIGGSYNNHPKKYKEKVTIEEHVSKKTIDILINILIKQGWYKGNQLEIDWSVLGYYLTGKRILSKAYSFIPLEFMDRMFKKIIDDKEKQSIFIKSKEVDKKYLIDGHPILIKSKRILEGYVFDGKEKWIFKTNDKSENTKLLKELRNHYLHWSAHYDEKVIGIPPMKPTSDRKRKEY